jgi:hypothetical protein
MAFTFATNFVIKPIARTNWFLTSPLPLKRLAEKTDRKAEKIVAPLFDFRTIIRTRFNEEGKMFAFRVVLRE